MLLWSYMLGSCHLLQSYILGAYSCTPSRPDEQRNLKPAILLCDDHQDCFMPYREQRRFDLYLMKGACLAGRACHDGLHALQSEGGRSEGRQDAYASELHSSWRQCVRCLTGPAL